MSYGWISLLPPLVAIVLAIASRRVIASLLLGVLAGALILKDWHENWNPLTAVAAALEQHLWTNLIEPDHMRVFLFTTLMGAMIGVMQASGGMQSVVDSLSPLARSRRGGQLITWALGLIIFFDDYANSLLLGNTMRPLADRLKISREKLSYLVDSTAAPVSGLAIVSTWVAGEIGFIRQGYEGLDLAEPVDGFAIFILSIPYRFYVLWALAFVPMVAILGRDFGPMILAERRSIAAIDPSGPARSVAPGRSAGWLHAAGPIVVVVAVTVWLIIQTGTAKLAAAGEAHPSLFASFGGGDSYLSLVYGSLSGLIVAMLLAWGQRVLTMEQIREAAMEGASHVLPALAILWLAWTLSGLTEKLGTGTYLASLVQQSVPVMWMPTIVYLLSSLVAFSTGTSWGTMGILMPLVVVVTYQMLGGTSAGVAVDDPLLVATVGCVLAGAIFGDHCSPISDTTVLSSQASGCDHVAHVWTQLPYALVVSAVAVVCGTIPVGFGISPWILQPIGLAAMLAILLVFADRPDR